MGFTAVITGAYDRHRTHFLSEKRIQISDRKIGHETGHAARFPSEVGIVF